MASSELRWKKAKVESHYRDKDDRSNRARFEKPISKLQLRREEASDDLSAVPGRK